MRGAGITCLMGDLSFVNPLERNKMWRKDMKFKIAVRAIIGAIAVCMNPAVIDAATSSANVGLRATIISEATLSAGTIESPNIKAGRNPGNAARRSNPGVTANVRAGSTPATLTIVANNDWEDEPGVAPAVAARATGSDTTCYFFPSTPVSRGKPSHDAPLWQGCSGSYSETFNLYLAKNWNCATDNHTVTVTYILTAP
jgi:hypothetical protein